MSQFSANAICRRIAELTIEAWPAVSGRVKIGMMRTVQALPKASVICDEINRVDGNVGKNRYSYSVTVYGRFDRVDDIDAEKDSLAESLYAAVVTETGRLATSGGDALAYLVNCTKVDRRDYLDENDKIDHFDLALTFTMQADVAR